MHTCPECGSACYCNADIDDIELDTGQDSCVHYTTDVCQDVTDPYDPFDGDQ